MTKTVLLTIGRLPKVLDLARSFHRCDYRVIIADPFRWHLMRVSNVVAKTYTVTAPADDRDAYLRDLVDIIAAERVTLVVPVSEETMYVTALRDHLPAGVAMFSPPQSVVLNLHSKLTFISTAAAFGLSVPETMSLDDARATPFAATRDYVLKPVFSCSGRGVTLHRAGDPIAERQDNEAAILQTRVDGDLFSTFTIAHAGKCCVTVAYRATVMSGTVAVAFERVSGQTAVETWVETFVEKASITGFISFDIIVNRQGVAFAIECNPRVTSGVHFIDQRDLAAAIIDGNRTEPVRLRPNRQMQQVYPCLTETQKSFFKSGIFKRNLKCLMSARDVTWSWRDPLPLLLMPVMASQIIARAITARQSFGEASTFDISWREPDAV